MLNTATFDAQIPTNVRTARRIVGCIQRVKTKAQVTAVHVKQASKEREWGIVQVGEQ